MNRYFTLPLQYCCMGCRAGKHLAITTFEVCLRPSKLPRKLSGPADV
jgi:hypothetical protein